MITNSRNNFIKVCSDQLRAKLKWKRLKKEMTEKICAKMYSTQSSKNTILLSIQRKLKKFISNWISKISNKARDIVKCMSTNYQNLMIVRVFWIAQKDPHNKKSISEHFSFFISTLWGKNILFMLCNQTELNISWAI